MHASPCVATHASAGAPSFFARLFRSPYRLLFWTLLLVLGLLASQVAFAATTYTVTDATDNAADTGSLRYAVNTATSGSDTIVFAPQVIGTITLTGGTLTINQNLTIIGPGANLLTISGNHAVSVFTVNSGTVSISGLTMANGLGAGVGGGGIFNAAALTVNDCAFSGNSGYNGGGIFNFVGGALAVASSTFSGNSAQYKGGGIANVGTLTVNNSTFDGNTAGGVGGALEDEGAGAVVANSTFTSNSAATGGGVLASNTITVTNSILAGNTGGDCDLCGTQSANNLIGGTPNLGPLQYNGGATQTMMPLPGSPAIGAGSSSTLATDQRGFARSTGGASDLGAVQTNYLTVTSNSDNTDTTTCAGGETCSLRDAINLANSNGSGDIVFQAGLTGTITLGSLLPDITGNLNVQGPGANQLTVSGNNAVTVFTIYAAGTVNISGMTIANGSNTANGGGIDHIFTSGTLIVSGCVFTGNTTTAGGAGIANGGTLILENSSFSGNASQAGGGLMNNGGIATVTNSTFFGNNSGAGPGGGIFNNGITTVSNSTITGNTGDGIWNNGGQTLTVTNSIVAGNTGGDCDNCTQNGPIVTGGNPMLGPLQLNGGSVPTMLPLPGSPAIQIGDPAQLPARLTMDERGFPRLTGGKLDVGAAQTNYTSVQFVGQPTNALVNAILAPAVTLEVLETNANLSAPNNTDAVNGIPVTLSFSGAGTLGGTLTQTTSGGAATFGDLKVNAAATGDTLAISLPVTPTGVTPAVTLTATSDPFDITRIVVPQAASKLTLTASANHAAPGAAVTLTATVTSATSATTNVPTGTVTFLIASGPLGTVTLNAQGVATLSVTTLPPGSNAIEASYSGDTNFTGSGGQLAVPVVIGTPSFTMKSNTPGLTIQSGQTGTATLTLVSTAGYSGTVNFSCNGLPEHSICNFAPSSVTFNGSASTVKVTVTIATNVTGQLRDSSVAEWKPVRFMRPSGGLPILPAMIFWLPGGLLALDGLDGKKVRKAKAKAKSGRMLWLVLLLALGAGALGLVGCGDSANYDTPAGQQTITIVAAGAGNVNQVVQMRVTVE